MPDYQKAAADLKARIEAKAKKKGDLNSFFEAVKASLVEEATQANTELAKQGACSVDFQQASLGEPTIELRCGTAVCQISQDRGAPSIGVVITAESGETTITFLILTEESPLKGQRVSLAPAVEAKVVPREIAAAIVEELIKSAP